MAQFSITFIIPRSKEDQTSNTGTKSQITNIKVNLKSYQTFNGNLTEWKPFKRQFLAIAKTHDFDY